jgi:hypothetical protein
MNLREAKGYTYGAYSRFDTATWREILKRTPKSGRQVTGDSLKNFSMNSTAFASERATGKRIARREKLSDGVFRSAPKRRKV